MSWNHGWVDLGVRFLSDMADVKASQGDVPRATGNLTESFMLPFDMHAVGDMQRGCESVSLANRWNQSG